MRQVIKCHLEISYGVNVKDLVLVYHASWQKQQKDEIFFLHFIQFQYKNIKSFKYNQARRYLYINGGNILNYWIQMLKFWCVNNKFAIF